MKTCTKCCETKALEEFYKGVNSCKACRKLYLATNKEKIAAKKREYYLANKEGWCAGQDKEKKRAANRIWCKKNYATNREEILKKQKIVRQSPEEKAKRAEYQRRREAVKRRSGISLQEEDRLAILAIYAEARRLTDETGIPHEVDHIVPLLGEKVCGLHVPCNLQIITKAENASKGNRFEIE